MPRILVTNDDGVRSEGLRALADALRPLGEVTVVAPIMEASAIGHALTLRRPLRIETFDDRTFAVDGTPTDCVNIGVITILKGLPDLVVSGINKGWNLGDDVTYSGTVAGAMEGSMLGALSFAVSIKRTKIGMRTGLDFTHAAASAAVIAERVLRTGLPPRTFLNVNLPEGRPKGFRLTTQAKRNHVTSVAEKEDPRGQPYFWIEEGQNHWEPDTRSDYQAVVDGFVSVTPLHSDLTNRGALEVLGVIEELSLGTEVKVT